mmetsp:Transcript_59712/g.142441  ORF Transcript_59712/g.142441 Transcript_59712/m.142441 type:complete len:476 (-) Transcript_59712:107-1534(-)|eukprot:CAMPEP_0181448074 /NCGR_PEP_ID=MMETSP1110-20121109/26951_1 /TAXON_ID=174948 /ORGANISM="Symbiodinium sp., Strain CCMP421" /LENGTH=475 /DNA_ID=CAMNT_0023572209 /DNA_START=38 /DNA_END=1465 /DNA_ORIENTATION=+
MTSVHQTLLDELRRRSRAPPQAAVEKPVPQELTSFSRQLDMLWPLVCAAWRCVLVRNAVVTSLGVILMIGFKEQPLWRIVGLLLAALGFRGLPGGRPFLEVKTQAGFYGAGSGPFGARNQRLRKALEAWLTKFTPCPWQLSGEVCTMLPYFINKKRFDSLPYERCWLQAEDGEPFAFDWVFPPSGYDPDQPVVVLLTGLAPNQHWTAAAGFIADAAWHFTHRCRTTVVVLVARGTMDTPVNTNVFHGARVTDLRQALEFLHSCLEGATGRTPKVFAAGYSMGAIILANYCGHFSEKPLLAGAVHFSGLHDAVYNMKFKYSEDTWQAYLAYNLKWSIVSNAPIEEARKRGVNMERIMSGKVASVVDIDKDFVSVFNGYDGVLDYYRDLSLAADDKWRKVSIPLLAVAARDDPITHCDALRAQEFSSKNPQLLFLITDRGGHVGWPWGMQPWKRGWDFINEAIQVFITAVDSQEGKQ